MPTAQTTRPPRWQIDINAWLREQGLNQNGFIELGGSSLSIDPKNTPWSCELLDCEYRKIISVRFDRTLKLFIITMLGRNNGETRQLPLFEGGFYETEAWQHEWSQTYLIDDLPEGGKKFLRSVIWPVTKQWWQS